MSLYYTLASYPDGITACTGVLRRTGTALMTTLNSELPAEQFATCWALAWLGRCRVWLPPSEPDVLGWMFRLWRQNTNPSVQSKALWALVSQPVMSRDAGRHCASIQREELQGLLEIFDQLNGDSEKIAVLVLAWYLRALSDGELVLRVRELLKDCRSEDRFNGSTLRELLEQLGEKVGQTR
jgi:hypothetical protein